MREYRQNFKSFRQGESFTTSTGEKIRFYDSNHVPGSVQVLVEIHDGTKILYSGDYNYPGPVTIKCHRGIMQILMMALESDNNLPQNLRYLANHKYSFNRCD